MDRPGILPERLPADDETPYCASTTCPSVSLQPAECSNSNSMLIRSQLRMDDVDDDKSTTEMDRLPKILEEDAEHLSSTLRFDKPFLHMLQLHRAACSLLSARTPTPCSQALTQASGLEIELLNRSPLIALCPTRPGPYPSPAPFCPPVCALTPYAGEQT